MYLKSLIPKPSPAVNKLSPKVATSCEQPKSAVICSYVAVYKELALQTHIAVEETRTTIIHFRIQLKL